MVKAVARHRYLLLCLAGVFPFFINGPINAIIYHNPYLYWGFELSIWVVAPLLILLAVSRTAGFRLTDLGFHACMMNYRNAAMVFILCLAFAPICYWLYASTFGLFYSLFPEGGFFQYQSVIPADGLPRLAVILYFALSAGLVEEFLFRGLLYRAAQDFTRPTLFYLLVSPLLFSLVHWESGIANLFATYVFGIFMAVSYLGFRNLWPLIAGHVYTDLIWFS